MSSSKLFASSSSVVVADASGIINLNATLVGPTLLELMPHRVVITKNAAIELEDGAKFGYDDAAKMSELIASGLLSVEDLAGDGLAIYEALISGTTGASLDDGEAATIGHAVHHAGIALMDERKALSLCRKAFPSLQLATTAELLLHPEVFKALGGQRQRDAMIGALKQARMRVPPELVDPVCILIGDEEVACCPSLPRTKRIPASTCLNVP